MSKKIRLAYEFMMDNIINYNIIDFWEFINGNKSDRNTKISFIRDLVRNLLSAEHELNAKQSRIADLILDADALPIDPNNFKLWCCKTGNYKYIPAVFALLEKWDEVNKRERIDVYTTGSWGLSIEIAAKDMNLDKRTINVVDVSNKPLAERFNMLRRNILNTDMIGGALGTFFVCMTMPGPDILKTKGRRILPRITQGNLLRVLITMGYEIGDDIRIKTAR